jgi:hypothetical protein
VSTDLFPTSRNDQVKLVYCCYLQSDALNLEDS